MTDTIDRILERWPEPPTTSRQRLHHTADVFAMAGDMNPRQLLIIATSNLYGEDEDGKIIQTGLRAVDLVALSEILKDPVTLRSLANVIEAGR